MKHTWKINLKIERETPYAIWSTRNLNTESNLNRLSISDLLVVKVSGLISWGPPMTRNSTETMPRKVTSTTSTTKLDTLVYGMPKNVAKPMRYTSLRKIRVYSIVGVDSSQMASCKIFYHGIINHHDPTGLISRRHIGFALLHYLFQQI